MGLLGLKTWADLDVPTLFELLEDSYPLVPASTNGKVLHILSLKEAFFENLIGFVQFLLVTLCSVTYLIGEGI